MRRPGDEVEVTMNLSLVNSSLQQLTTQLSATMASTITKIHNRCVFLADVCVSWCA